MTQVSPPNENVNVPSKADPVSLGRGLNDPIPSTSRSQQIPIPSTSQSQQALTDPIPSTSGAQTSNQASSRARLLQQNLTSNAHATKPSELVFENNSLKMTVLQAAHLQEKRFDSFLKKFSFYFRNGRWLESPFPQTISSNRTSPRG